MQHPSQPLGPTSHMGDTRHSDSPPCSLCVDENMNIHTPTHVYVKHTHTYMHLNINTHTHTHKYTNTQNRII